MQEILQHEEGLSENRFLGFKFVNGPSVQASFFNSDRFISDSDRLEPGQSVRLKRLENRKVRWRKVRNLDGPLLGREV